MAVTLAARTRSERGKNAARKLRRMGYVPAVVYGHGDQTQELSISAYELARLLARVSAETTIIDLEVDGGARTPTLIRAIQYHATRPDILHVDFYGVRAGERLTLDVPVRLQGTPYGVREQMGILQEVLRELSVECLPGDIPEAIDVDVTELRVGDSVYVRDVSISEDAQILNDPELVVCVVSSPTVQALEEEEETEEGVAGDVEPELVRGHREDAESVPAEHGSRQPE